MKVQLDVLRDTARRIWVVYRLQVLLGTAGASVSILVATDHQLVAMTLFVLWLVASAAFSHVHTKKAARVLTGDLREKQVSATRMMIRRLLAVAVFYGSVLVVTVVWPSFWETTPCDDSILDCILSLLKSWALVFTGLAIMYRLMFAGRDAATRLHTGTIVLWLRRFHAEPLQGLSFPIILGHACSGQALPVTLQDDAYTHCPVAGHFQAANSLATMLPTILPVTAGLLFFLWFSVRFLPSSVALHPATSLVMTGFVLVIIKAVMRRRARRQGIAEVGHVDVNVELKALLEDLCKRKKRLPGLVGLIVLKVPNESWQTAVATVLERSAAVVIDVTDLSDNLAWELSSALKMHPPERMVIAARMKAGASNRDCERAVRASIQQIVTSELAERFRIFLYPDALGRSRLFLPPKRLISELQSLIQESLYGRIPFVRQEQPGADAGDDRGREGSRREAG